MGQYSCSLRCIIKDSNNIMLLTVFSLCVVRTIHAYRIPSIKSLVVIIIILYTTRLLIECMDYGFVYSKHGTVFLLSHGLLRNTAVRGYLCPFHSEPIKRVRTQSKQVTWLSG